MFLGLFIEPRAWLFTVLMGSSRLVGHWARLPRFGSPRFSGRCTAGGRPVCSVGGLQAREGPTKFKQKPLFSFFPAAMFGGKKKEEQCRSKRHRSALFFFFECMKRRRFGENAPFYLYVAPERTNVQISPQSSFVHFNCIPAKFVPALIVGRVFHFGPWPLISLIKSPIGP